MAVDIVDMKINFISPMFSTVFLIIQLKGADMRSVEALSGI